MTYYFKTETLLLSKFNVANKLNLKPEHVKFVNPRPADTVDITMSKVYNTAIDVAMQPGAPYSGTVTIYYNRVNLLTEFSNVKLDSTNFIKIGDGCSVHEELSNINVKLGTRFTMDDIEDVVLPKNRIFISFKIQAKSTSLQYTGSINVRVYRATAVDGAIKHEPSAVWIYDKERKREAPTFGENSVLQRMYSLDYTAARNSLLRIKTVKAVPVWNNGFLGNSLEIDLYHRVALALDIKLVDGLPWVAGAGKADYGKYNLNRAICIYNGPTDKCRLKPYGATSIYSYRAAKNAFFNVEVNPANQNYKYVAALLLDNPTSSNDMYRTLALFHYN